MVYIYDQQHCITILTYGTQTLKTKYFASSLYEKEVNADNSIRELLYIYATDGLVAIYEKKSNGTNNQLYVHKDHLGSLVSLTNSSGALVQEFSYDAWGKRSLITDNTGSGQPYLDRGYTLHEHLDAFGVINMNGRVYDPLIGRFLSPDNFVQAPGFTQSYNRYSYCVNNPLKYSDPSGELFGIDNNLIKFFVVQALAQITGSVSNYLIEGLGISGALGQGFVSGTTSFLSNGLTSVITNGKWDMEYALKSGLFSGLMDGFQGFNRAEDKGLNPWTGTGWSACEFPVISDEINNSNTKRISDEALDCLARSISGVGLGDYGIQKIANETPSGFKINPSGNFSNGKITNAMGLTHYKWFRRCEIYVSPGAVSDRIILRPVLGHELSHAWDNYCNFPFSGIYSKRDTEHNASLVAMKMIEPYKSISLKYAAYYYLWEDKVKYQYPTSTYKMVPFYYHYK